MHKSIGDDLKGNEPQTRSRSELARNAALRPRSKLCITAVHKPGRSLESCTGAITESVMIGVGYPEIRFPVMHSEAPAAC